MSFGTRGRHRSTTRQRTSPRRLLREVDKRNGCGALQGARARSSRRGTRINKSVSRTCARTLAKCTSLIHQLKQFLGTNSRSFRKAEHLGWYEACKSLSAGDESYTNRESAHLERRHPRSLGCLHSDGRRPARYRVSASWRTAC